MNKSMPMGNDIVPHVTGAGQQILQTGNTANGHIGAGDINDVTVHGDVNITLPTSPIETTLGRLYRKLREEAAGDQDLTDYIADLQIFTRVVEHEDIQGLDGKFSAAAREDQLDMAKAMKELIYSELRQNMFSKTFQTIYATLMEKIFEEFQTWVRPAIKSGATRDEIDLVINQKIVQPIVKDLESCNHFDGVATQKVRGMLYFLTGNCHLVWH